MKAIFFLLLFPAILLAQPATLKESSIKQVKTIKGQVLPLVQPGKVLVLDFFVTSCSHCQLHSPHMAELVRKYGSRLQIISFASDGAMNPGPLAHYIQQYNVINPVVNLTNDFAIEFIPKVRDVPQMLIYDQNGQFQKMILGWNEQQKAVLDNWMEALMPPVPAKSPASKARRNRR